MSYIQVHITFNFILSSVRNNPILVPTPKTTPTPPPHQPPTKPQCGSLQSGILENYLKSNVNKCKYRYI
jgi:hypothetical protein